MNAFLHEWLNVLLRVAHVVAAIMWIGDSFLFMWLDSSLRRGREDRPGDVAGELWMTHSGGFYEVVKYRSLARLPERLYWFMWQSYSTWITGVLLLAVVFGLGGRAMLLGPDSTLAQGSAVAIAFGVLVAGWLVYEGLCRIPALRGPAFAVAGLAVVTAAAWWLGQVFTPRAAFLLTGAACGTIMTANVFFVIIPGQSRMVAATREGRAVDVSHGLRAKERSTHNHYLTLPVLLMMLSNHFPALYGAPHAWAVLGLLFVFGAGAKLMMNRLAATPWPVVAGTLASLAGAIAFTLPPGPGAGVRALAGHAPVDDATARAIVQARCASCHATHPGNEAFTAPPAGVVFESPEQMRAYADRILFRVVETKTMPLGNLTGITDEERVTLGAWAWQQTHGGAGSRP
ncbi:MAG: urate hydroxylase PuuD [Candidatus Eisenbacteria bacterium]|nr:urate hydroxylase PuuD [Candidatus Eisenbacteria bacterium]